jgi:hypothetical protein
VSAIPPAVARVFLEAFTARDIAEPLPSFDAEASGDSVRQALKRHRLEFAGIRKQGAIVGCVAVESLRSGPCGEFLQPFPEADVLPDTTPLLDVLRALHRSPQVFVECLGSVCGTITRNDLQKPPVRMWLFGIVTLIEMRFLDLVDRDCSADEWMAHVSEGRLTKARDLLADRKRRGQSPRLIDCLQFSDKGQLVARIERLRCQTVFHSRRQAEAAVKRLEQLRNNLAHAQDIVTADWETIVLLSELLTERLAPPDQGP